MKCTRKWSSMRNICIYNSDRPANIDSHRCQVKTLVLLCKRGRKLTKSVWVYQFVCVCKRNKNDQLGSTHRTVGVINIVERTLDTVIIITRCDCLRYCHVYIMSVSQINFLAVRALCADSPRQIRVYALELFPMGHAVCLIYLFIYIQCVYNIA